MSIVRHIPWTEQPQNAVPLLLPEGVPYPKLLLSGPHMYGWTGAPTLGSGTTRGVSTAGLSLKVTRVTDGGLSLGVTDQPIKTDAWTVIVLSNNASSANQESLYNQRGSGVTNIGFLFGVNMSNIFGARAGGVAVAQQHGTSVLSGVHTTNTTLVDGKFHVFAASRAGSGVFPKIWVDGAAQAITSSGTAASTINATQESVIGGVGNYSTDAAYVASAQFPFVALWDSELTENQIRLISSNVWGVFAPRMQRFWAPSLGGAYTLNAETGVYTFTGSNATLLHNYALTLDSASYSLTGSNATLLKGLILDAASGSYTLTGSNATLVYNKILNASSGSYSVTGADANLIYTPTAGAYVLNAESGAYVLTGSDVTFSYSGGTITLKAGSWIRYRIIT